jgi:hypothetical protein
MFLSNRPLSGAEREETYPHRRIVAERKTFIFALAINRRAIGKDPYGYIASFLRLRWVTMQAKTGPDFDSARPV